MPRERTPSTRARHAAAARGKRRGQHDEDHQPRAERDRGRDEPVVEARAELTVHARLQRGEHADQHRAAERDPGGHAGAGHSPIMPGAGRDVAGRGYPGVCPRPRARAPSSPGFRPRFCVVVIGLVVLATFAVQGSWWAEDRPAASADQKASDGSSMLTDAGFDYVNVEGVAARADRRGRAPGRRAGHGSGRREVGRVPPPRARVMAGGEDVYVVDDVAALTAVTQNGATRLGDAHVRQPRHVVGCRRTRCRRWRRRSAGTRRRSPPRRAARRVQPQRHGRRLHRGRRSVAGRRPGDRDAVRSTAAAARPRWR